MTKPKVLFIGDLNTQLPEYKDFSSRFDCVKYEVPSTKEELISDFKNKFQDVSAIYGAWLGFGLLGGFKDEIVAAAPPSLKVVLVCSVGYNHYNGEQMAERGIALTNVPSDSAADPVADLVLYNTLAAFRNFKMASENFAGDIKHLVQARCMADSNEFDLKTGSVLLKPRNGYSFGEQIGGRPCLNPKNHNVVIVGFGNIGQTIARRLSLIGMHIHYVKRRRLSESEEADLGFPVTYHATISDAKEVADLVVIACPGTPETYHLIDGLVISSFAKPIRIINIGRGSVIDEQALVDGLKLGKVLFAGLDVFENEPNVHPELFGRQDVVLTPHIGASTVENFDYTAIYAMKNIEDILGGGPGLSRVN